MSVRPCVRHGCPEQHSTIHAHSIYAASTQPVRSPYAARMQCTQCTQPIRSACAYTAYTHYTQRIPIRSSYAAQTQPIRSRHAAHTRSTRSSYAVHTHSPQTHCIRIGYVQKGVHKCNASAGMPLHACLCSHAFARIPLLTKRCTHVSCLRPCIRLLESHLSTKLTHPVHQSCVGHLPILVN